MRALTITDLVIERLHKKFVKDGNPLRVWQAYQWSRRPPRPLPDWVADYLDGCAAALLYGTPPDAKRIVGTPPLAVSDTPPAAKMIVGMRADKALLLATKGGHSKHRQLADDLRDSGIYSYLDFQMRITRDELPPDEDLTKDERAAVAKMFAPLRRGESKIDRICARVAKETRRRGNGFSYRPLSAKTVRDIYFRLKRKA